MKPDQRYPVLSIDQGFLFPYLKTFLLLISRANLKAAKVKLQSKNSLEKSTSLSHHKSEFQTDVNRGLV